MIKEISDVNKIEKKNSSLKKGLLLIAGLVFFVRMINDFLNKPKEYIPTQDYSKKDGPVTATE